MLVALAAGFNLARFGEITEFGHRYLEVRQQAHIEEFGLFNLRYLPRNLAAALTLLPSVSSQWPFLSISGHGLALWFPSPALLWLLRPAKRGPLHRPLWITVALVALWTLLYQNTGWFQFGYRFSLDYMVFLIALLAVGERPLGRIFRTLVIVGIVISLFGAVTFQRFNHFYRPGLEWRSIAATTP